MKKPESTKCHYCYRSLTKYEITLDHKTPRCAGGTAARSNIVFACELCNLCKGSTPYAIFLIQIALVPIDPTVALAYQSIRSHHRRWLRAVRALRLFAVDTPISAVAVFSAVHAPRPEELTGSAGKRNLLSTSVDAGSPADLAWRERVIPHRNITNPDHALYTD